MGSGLVLVGMIGTVKATRTPSTNSSFHQSDLFKSSSGGEMRRGGLLRVAGDDAGDRRTRELHLYILGNFQIDNFGLNTLDRPVNPARRDDAIALFQRAEHLLLLLALFVRRSDDDEVETPRDRDERQELQKRGGAAGTLKQSYRIHSISSFCRSPLATFVRNVSRNAANELDATACRIARIKSR